MRVLVLLQNVVQCRILHCTCNVLLFWTTCKVPWQLRIRRKLWVSAVNSCHFLCVWMLITSYPSRWMNLSSQIWQRFSFTLVQKQNIFSPLFTRVIFHVDQLCVILTDTAGIFWSLSNFSHLHFCQYDFLCLFIVFERAGSHYWWISVHSSSIWNCWVERTAVDTSTII